MDRGLVIGWSIFAAVTILFFWGFIVLLQQRDEEYKKARAEFMTECTQYQKKYECTALWRAGNRSSSVPMVVPVVTPVVVR